MEKPLTPAERVAVDAVRSVGLCGTLLEGGQVCIQRPEDCGHPMLVTPGEVLTVDVSRGEVRRSRSGALPTGDPGAKRYARARVTLLIELGPDGDGSEELSAFLHAGAEGIEPSVRERIHFEAISLNPRDQETLAFAGGGGGGPER